MDEAGGVNEVEAWAEKAGLFGGHRFFKTSGSSGVEKWVALSEGALEWSARSVIEALGIVQSDVLGLALQEVHVGGFGLVVRARIAGAKLERFEGKWNAGWFSDWCGENGVTVSSLVPTQVHDLVAGGFRGAESLRVIVVGGGAFDDDLKERARELGWPVVPSYGMTETSSQVATGDGLPLLPGWSAKLVDGRLALNGGGLLTAEIRRSGRGFVAEDPKVEGWYVTSDRAELRDGGLRILGRADRLVKVLGELVDLEKLEGFWRGELGREVALVTEGDERRGVNLFLYHEGGEMDLSELNEGLPGLERLAGWRGMPELPRSPLGKIDRVALGKFSKV